MSKKSNSPNVVNIYAPTNEELVAIGNGVFVLKKKPENVVISSFHKWERVWEDNLTLRVVGEPDESVYRAMSFSVPLHLGGPGNESAETQYSGFVLAISKGGKDIRVLPISKVRWGNGPIAESPVADGNEADKKACDPSTTHG